MQEKNDELFKFELPEDLEVEHRHQPHSTFVRVGPVDTRCFVILEKVVWCIRHPCHRTSGKEQRRHKLLK